MRCLLLIFSVLECYATSGPAVCTSEALQSQCGGEGCPIAMRPNDRIVFFYNYSSIQLTYVMTGTSLNRIEAYVMDQQNYRLYLANQPHTFNYGASEYTGAAAGVCKTGVIENTKGIGSVLILICLTTSPVGSNCSIWYNESFVIFADRCAPNCITGMAANGVCDSVCDSIACGYDGGDCPIPTTHQTFLCSTGCTADIRGDGYCDAACDNSQCNYDDGDCPFNTNPAPTSVPQSRSPSALFPAPHVVPQANRASVLSIFE